jgi:hypothetical protein
LRPVGVRPLAGAHAKEIAEAEEVAEDVVELGEDIGIDARTAGLQAIVTIAVVGGTALRIAQHAVRFGELLELLLGGLVARLRSGGI